MHNFLSKVVLIFVITAFLTGCGFHLREAFLLPAEYTPVSIEAPRKYREFGSILEQEIRRANIPMANSSQNAKLLVKLSNVDEREDLLTASATGSPLERKLILRARVNWENPQGEDVIESEEFTLQRTFVYDDTAVLAKSREAQNLMRELERELSRRIILRMRQLGS